MKKNQKSALAIVLLLALSLIIGACQPTPAPTAAAPASDATVAATPAVYRLRVGVSPVPHAEIVGFVKDSLAPNVNLIIEPVEFTDYILPNVALQDATIDVNFFQHQPYLDDYNKEHGSTLVSIAPIHVEPLGIYAKELKSLDELPDGAQVAIPNDATNGGRALELLESAGLLKLKEGSDFTATLAEIVDNPKGLKIIELEAAQLPRSLEDTDLAVINGNYALEAGLVPATDALALESVENNPYANVLVVKEGRENDPAILLFKQLMTSSGVIEFLEQKYQGSVIPAFTPTTMTPF